MTTEQLEELLRAHRDNIEAIRRPRLSPETEIQLVQAIENLHRALQSEDFRPRE